MASYWSTYGNPDWYKQNIKPEDAQTQAKGLGISTDQLFQLYAQTNLPGYGGGTIPSGGLQPTQQQLMQFARGPGLAGAAQQQQGGGPQPYGPQPGTTSQGIVQQTPHGSIQPSGYQGWAIPAAPSASGAALSGIYGPMATWQNVTGAGQGNQSNQPPTWNQVGQAAGLSPSDVSQFQAMGRAPAAIAQQFNVPGLGQGFSPQQFQVPQQVVPTLTGQTVVPTAQPVKQYQSGGLVTQDPSVPANYYGTQYPLYAQNAQGNPTGQPIYASPLSQANLLGAAATQSVPIINQAPSGTPSSVSGVAPTPGALVGTSVPQVGWGTNEAAWDQLAQTAGLSGSDISQFAKAGYTPAQVAQKFNVGTPLGGPWLNPQIGSVFTPVARTAPTQVTPLRPAAQPTATAYSPTPTPFAQAPPAPGLNIPQIPPQMSMGAGATPPQMTSQPALAQSPFVAAHTNALVDAGKALFAHFGGDPDSASPAAIADFHRQLTEHLTAASQPIAAKKMQSGGRVPGRGNEDTVPALLTPGEYVIPKPQVQQLMRTGKLPIKMADGGTVPDSDQNAPPEARRKTISAQASDAPPSQTSTAPTVPTGSSLTTGLATAAQTYANRVGGGGGIPAGSTAGAGAYGTVGSLMAGQGSAGAAGSLGQLPAGGGMGSALSGVASGLGQVAAGIQASAQPWRMQQNAIPAPPPAPAAPQFAQQQIPQQTQQGTNPYAAYAMNQARYPTSPYYT